MKNEKNELCSFVFSENKYDKREYLNACIKLIEMCACKKINAQCKGKAFRINFASIYQQQKLELKS